MFPHYINREVTKLYGLADRMPASELLQKSLLLTRYAVAFSQGPLVLPASYLFEVQMIDGLLRDLSPLVRLGQLQIVSPVADIEKYAAKKAPEYRDGPDLFGYNTPVKKRVDSFTKLLWRPRVRYSSSAEIAATWREALVQSGGLWNEILRSASVERTANPSEVESGIHAVPDRLEGRAFIADFALPMLPLRIDDRDRTRVNLLINSAYLLSYLMEFDATILVDTPLGPLDCGLVPASARNGRPPVTVSFAKLKRVLQTIGLEAFCSTCAWKHLVELRWDPVFSWLARYVVGADQRGIDVLVSALLSAGNAEWLATRPWPASKPDEVRETLVRLAPVVGALMTDFNTGGTVSNPTFGIRRPRRLSAADEVGDLFGKYEKGSGIPERADVSLQFKQRRAGFRKRHMREFLSVRYECEAEIAAPAAGARTAVLTNCRLRRLVDDLEGGEFNRLTTRFGGIEAVEAMVGKECYFEAMPPVAIEPSTVTAVERPAIQRLAPLIQVLLVTTTEIERNAVLAEMQPAPGHSSVVMGTLSDQIYRIGTVGRHVVGMIQTTMGSQGEHGSTLDVYHPVKELPALKAIVAVGIAFGVDRSKLRAGDVMIAAAVQPYELAKVNGEASQISYRSLQIPCGRNLLEVFRHRNSDWRRERMKTRVAVQPGLLLSGEKVVNDRKFRDELVRVFPMAIGGEMEGTGAYAAASRGKVEGVVVKAICDWADGHKNDAAQPFAAVCAVSLVMHVLRQDGALEPLGILLSTPS